MNVIDLKEQLGRQLRFLERSSKLYDEGHEDEAIRLAVVMRVLIHDTPKSTSLLTLLGKKDVIKLATSFKEIDISQKMFFAGGLSEFGAEWKVDGEGGVKLTGYSKPGGLMFEGFLTVNEWWNQVVYVFMDGEKYTRNDLIRTAANKDGGAHVDEKLPAIYMRIAEGVVSSRQATEIDEDGNFEIEFTFGHDIQQGEVIKNFHFSDIRQMASELLNSPDLLALQ